MAETEAGENLIPARRWIRGHYTKLTRSNKARCNHCTEKFSIYLSCSAILHKHLVNAHPDKLTEEEKKEMEFHWTWDYFTLNSHRKATCKECKKIIKYDDSTRLKLHLKRIHMISCPTSDNVIDNESSSDEDMDANKNVTFKKLKRQKTSSNSTNLSDDLYEYAEGTEEINEGTAYNLIPIRRWMREHYTKLTSNNRARCNHCNGKFSISINHLYILHKHLVEVHPDKLAEEEKNEVKFYWVWDYYIAKSNTEATCKLCKITVRYKDAYHLKVHLKTHHEILGPTSNNVMDNESSSDDDMDANKAVTFRKLKRQKALSNSTNLSDDLYECAEGTEAINQGTPYNLIPIRRWMREHYTKLTRNNRVRCNHCNGKFNIPTKRLNSLHKHLVEAHPDKLAEEEKNEVKFHWAWDYYIAKNNTEATCKLCKITVRYKTISYLKIHLKTHHMILGPTSGNVMDDENSSDDDVDANKNITLRKAKRQEPSTNLSDSLYECAEGTKAINEGTPYNLIPIRRWMREHYTKSTRNNRARCNHCNGKFNIRINRLNSLHKHLIETHPDKLTEEEKNEVKFHWAWDYYIAKGNTEAICKLCKITVRYKTISYLKIHLKTHHKILGPTSGNVMDDENSSDDDVDANKNITLRKAKRQEPSTNLSDSLYECAEGTKAINEGTPYNLIPIRRWMREHYTKSTRNNRARCNHCNEKFSIQISYLSTLHKHLVEIHSDKLVEEEKNEVKFYWAWDYYIVKSNTEATCKLCKVTVRYKDASHLRSHLKNHGILGPSSDSVIYNESTSGCDMIANKNIAVRKTKRQKVSSNSTSKSNLYECTERIGAINGEAAKDFIPVRCWIREHYTKLTRNNEATCNHCNAKFFIHMNYLIILHKHLVEAHPDKLAEEQKKEIKFHWIWDHYIAKSDRRATCKRCKATVKYNDLLNLRSHLKRIHKISGPTSNNVIDNQSSSDDDMDTINKNIATSKAKRQKASSNSTNKSNNLCDCTEETGAINRIFGPGSNNHMDNENNSSNYVDADRNMTIKNAKYQEVSNSIDSCDNSYEKTGGTEDLNEFVTSASNSMDHIMESLSDTDSTEYVKSSNSDDDLSFDEIFDLFRQE